MKSSTLLALATAIASTAASGCEFVGGNYYCNLATKIIYEGVGFSGSYLDVTNMDETTGSCSLEIKSFLGSLSPFDEELSLHFRGPLNLVQFGVYYPSAGSNAKRDVGDDCSTTQHLHHKHVKRATAMVTETVYVDQNGNTITSTLTTTPTTAPILGNSAPAAGSAPSGVSSGVYTAVPSSVVSSSSSSSSSSSASSLASSAPSSGAAAGDWVRASYYTPGTGNNVTFLNNYGGSGSGVWSSAFGNSLSYANSDNTGGSASPQILSDCTIPSNTEFVIMSGLECGADSETGDCGYYRGGIPAFHGWGGQNKLFVFEFLMPSSSATGFNGDMPAVWMLNAKIPRTLQYGDASCSCWKTGCGELDLFEILSTGSDKCITALHNKQGGSGAGSSDYFTRPTSSTMKAAVIFTESNIHIMTVDGASFDSVLSSDTVQKWISATGTTVTMG